MVEQERRDMIPYYLYKFKKRRNSTKVPPTSAIRVEGKVVLKHPTDLINPVVILAADHGTVDDHDVDIMDSNYGQLLGRYYWITQIISVNLNHWEIHMEVDPMATWQYDIKRTNVFAIYTANLGSDGLIDGRLPRQTNGYQTKRSVAHGWKFEGEGSYVLSVVNKNGVENFVLNSRASLQGLLSAFETYVNQLKAAISKPSDPDDETFDEEKPNKSISKNIYNFAKSVVNSFKYLGEMIFNVGSQTLSVGDVGQNIKCCIWYPFTLTTVGGGKEIVIGNFKTGITAPMLVPQSLMTWTLPNFTAPDVGFDAAWLRRAGYAEWAIHLPFAGTFPLPNDLMYPGRGIRIGYTLSPLTGVCQIYADLVQQDGGGNRRMVETQAQLACNVMVGSVVPNLASMISNTISAQSSIGTAGMAAAAATVNPAAITGVIGGASSTGQSALNVINEAINPTSYTVGGWSGSGYVPPESLNVEIYCAHYGVSQDPPSGCSETAGIPTFKQVNLGSVNGYVLCNGASVSCAGTASEIDCINSYLNSGAFIE